MYCSNCGRQLEDGMVFCSNCGKPTSNAQKLKQKKQSVKFFVGAACALVLSILGGVMASYLNVTELSGNAKKVVRALGSSQEIAWMGVRERLQSIAAYGFIVLLVIAVILFVIGMILRRKERGIGR